MCESSLHRIRACRTLHGSIASLEMPFVYQDIVEGALTLCWQAAHLWLEVVCWRDHLNVSTIHSKLCMRDRGQQRVRLFIIACRCQDAVVDILLGAVRMDAALSLEPVLALLSVLGRDLQNDCVPFVPRIIDALTGLVEQGALSSSVH